jgi:hypothetical protein
MRLVQDKWGISWQITRLLTEALAAGGEEARGAFEAMMGMRKIDVAAIKAARRGDIPNWLEGTKINEPHSRIHVPHQHNKSASCYHGVAIRRADVCDDRCRGN